MNIQDSVAWNCFIHHDACVSRAWSIWSCPFDRPRNAVDDLGPVAEAALQSVVVVLRVGEALDVGVHAILNSEHDDVVEAAVCAVETGKQRAA